ncbi:MAG TPA: hypothetical protein VM487_03330 [Phycisphaerae bacterium]|nr:hypothetical protein [Phycisphaerae bacterium]
MKFFWIPFLIALAVAIALFLVEGPFVCFGTFAGFIAALMTLAGALACIKAYRNPDVEADSRGELTRSNVGFAAAAAGLILIGYIMLALTALGRTREFSKTAVSAANLRGVGQAMELYTVDFGDYPPSPVELVAAGHSTWAEFCAFLDPDIPDDRPLEVAQYSSFVLRPGAGEWKADPKLLLAYERSPRTPVELRVIPRRGRWVLFGDGNVRTLDDGEFEAARQVDAARRKELDWPPPVD